MLLHKLREAMASTLGNADLAGEVESEEGASTNWAESYFARLRRAEFGQYHRISGHLLHAYANECAFRENNRRNDNGRNWTLATGAALAHPKSATWAGYWHRKAA